VVLISSAFRTLETALEAVRAGHTLREQSRSRHSVRCARSSPAPSRDARAPTSEVGIVHRAVSADGLVGRSGGMLAVYSKIALACASDAPSW